MSKDKLVESIMDTIKAWQDENGDGSIHVNGDSVKIFLDEIIADIDRNYKECDISKVDDELNRSIEELKLLKELDSENSHVYTKGKIIAFKTVKKILS